MKYNPFPEDDMRLPGCDALSIEDRAEDAPKHSDEQRYPWDREWNQFHSLSRNDWMAAWRHPPNPSSSIVAIRLRPLIVSPNNAPKSTSNRPGIGSGGKSQ